MITDKEVAQYLATITDKAQKFDFIMPWLRENLTGKQLNELSLISDPLTRRILIYLMSDDAK